ncbi:MAG: hypothetical protein H7Y88_08580 [Phycisphaerales bacterium]|nr:hypothetical protein [Phycisphaerales bacterium]
MPPVRRHSDPCDSAPPGGPGPAGTASEPSQFPNPGQPHPANPAPACTPRALPGGRLNLLLSCASWRDSWADRIPQLLEPMGVSSLRARSAREAERTIRSVPVHIAIVDLGIPLDQDAGSSPASPPAEEAGPRILELLRRLECPPPTVVVKGPRTTRDNTRSLSVALRCDAFAVVDRAAADLELMLEVLRRVLRRHYQDRWPDSPS